MSLEDTKENLELCKHVFECKHKNTFDIEIQSGDRGNGNRIIPRVQQGPGHRPRADNRLGTWGKTQAQVQRHRDERQRVVGDRCVLVQVDNAPFQERG